MSTLVLGAASGHPALPSLVFCSGPEARSTWPWAARGGSLWSRLPWACPAASPWSRASASLVTWVPALRPAHPAPSPALQFSSSVLGLSSPQHLSPFCPHAPPAPHDLLPCPWALSPPVSPWSQLPAARLLRGQRGPLWAGRAGGAAGRWLRIADETRPFVVPPQAQYFFLGAGCVPGRADDGCARRARLPASFPSRSFPLRFNAAPAPPLLPGHCQPLPGPGGVAGCPAVGGCVWESDPSVFSPSMSRAAGIPWDQGGSFSPGAGGAEPGTGAGLEQVWGAGSEDRLLVSAHAASGGGVTSVGHMHAASAFVADRPAFCLRHLFSDISRPLDASSACPRAGEDGGG